MRRIHLSLGLLALAGFLITGAFMRAHSPPMPSLPGEIRMLYRSRHLYILGSAVANLLLGVYFSPHSGGWRRALQSIGSGLFLIAPGLLTLGFVIEPPRGLTDDTYSTSFGLYAMYGGAVAHLVSGRPSPAVPPPHSARNA